MRRMQSPSSINTYLQCPRKYYCIYNLRLPQKPSIHLARGKAAHSALENFFCLKPEVVGDDFEHTLRIVLLDSLKRFWRELKHEFDALDMPSHQINEYYKDTEMMLSKWLGHFTRKIKGLMSKGSSFAESFKSLSPQTEIEYRSEDLMVRGYIDAIENISGSVRLMDYKTSKRTHISDEYRLQLAIYALLYEEKHGVRPDLVGIYFLRDIEQTIPADDELINHARNMISHVHAMTEEDDIALYPKCESPLCKWSTGQCDFYEYCAGLKELPQPPEKKQHPEEMNSSVGQKTLIECCGNR